MIEVLTKFAFIHKIGKTHGFGTVDQAEGDLGVRAIAKHGLAHQEFIEIRINQRPDNRIDLPFVVPDSGGDVHVASPSSAVSVVTSGDGSGPREF